MCHVSHVTTCHVSRVTCHVSQVIFFLDKVVKLIGGGSVNFFKIQIAKHAVILKLKITYAFHLLDLLHKKSVKMQPKNNLQQYPVCLEQQIYASQENFTHPLVVMVETLRRSAP